MSRPNDHVDFETLSDFADDALDASERERVQRHVLTCAECEERLGRLRTLLGAAFSLPPEVDPPAHLWGEIRERITAASNDPISLTRPRAATPRELRRGLWIARNPWLLAAAAVLLVAVTSIVTTAIVRPPSVVVAVQPAVSGAPNASGVVLPASALSIQADYARTVAELRETLELRRAGLDPATVVKVEASLRVIDEAIAEALQALAADPANLTLVDILSANYERKLELLRRAAELPSST